MYIMFRRPKANEEVALIKHVEFLDNHVVIKALNDITIVLVNEEAARFRVMFIDFRSGQNGMIDLRGFEDICIQ